MLTSNWTLNGHFEPIKSRIHLGHKYDFIMTSETEMWLEVSLLLEIYDHTININAENLVYQCLFSCSTYNLYLNKVVCV